MSRISRVLAFVVILARCFNAPAFAQESNPPARKPIELNLWGGAMQFAERGQPDKRDFVYRLSLSIPAPNGITAGARVDYTRTQDGGDLFDIETFRSVEAYLGGRKDVARNLSVSAFSGVSWDRDKDFDPADARLWTAAVGLRYAVPGRGYVLAAAGHHGPVGGSAFLGSVVYELSSSTNWFFDIAVPLDADRFKLRPYTVKAGVAARLKFWTF